MRMILLLFLATLCIQTAHTHAQPLRMLRTHYEFRFHEFGGGRWGWSKAPGGFDSSALVRRDGFLVSALSGGVGFTDTLHVIGDWPGAQLCVNGRAHAHRPVEPVPPRHVGRFTEDEWRALGEDMRAEIRDGTEHWPVQYGAPFIDFDGDGRYTPQPGLLPVFPADVPLVVGDEALWTLTGDGETPDRRRMGLNTTGISLQHMAWSHTGEGCPEWVLFQRLRIVNTTARHFTSMHIGMYADVALGDPSDDLVGIDTALGFAYLYNASDRDAYMTDPPAAGYLLLQGPAVEDESSTGLFDLSLREGIRNLPFHAFTYFSDAGEYQSLPDTTDSAFPYAMRNAMLGLHPDGREQKDPTTSRATRFAAAGNPLLKFGWIDGEHAAAGDRTLLVSMGPFDLAAGDTQEVIMARFGVQGGPTKEEDLIALFDYAQCVSAHYMAQFVTSAERPRSTAPRPREIVLGAPWPQPYAASSASALRVPVTLRVPRSVTLRVVDLLGRTRFVQEHGMMPGGTARIAVRIPAALAAGVYQLVVDAGSERFAVLILIE